MAGTRIEQDAMGELAVPETAYYGAQTQRAARNFQLSGLRFSRVFLRVLALIKRCAAEVNRDIRLLSPELAGAIVDAAQDVADGKFDDQFILDVFQTGSGTSTNMNANEVIAGIANERLTGVRGGRAPVHPNDIVNMGQSSNDVFPTTIHVAALCQFQQELLPALTHLQNRLQERAGALDAVVKIGRTHLQDAVPIRLGQEFSGYASQVEHAIRRLRQCGESLSELAIGGTALGTGINTHPEFAARMARALSAAVGIPLRPASCPFEAIAQRDAAVEASGALKTVAVSLSCIANNIRWMSSGPRCGIGELRLPALQPGSSIMPGKVNPVIPEAVMMVAAQVVGNDATITWANAMGSAFDLNVMMPVIAYNLLQSIDLLTTAARHLADRCVDASEFLQGQDVQGPVRLEADAARCQDLVEKSLAMCTALAPRIGYDSASAIAKTAHREKKTIRDVCRELPGMTPEQIAARLGPPASSQGLQQHAGFPTLEELNQILDPIRQTSPRIAEIEESRETGG